MTTAFQEPIALIAAARDRVLAGEDLDAATVLALAAVPDAALPALWAAAQAVRAQAKGRWVTYSPKVFIPLTRWCRDACRYCTFRTESGPPYLEPEAVLAIARAGERAGCREALFTLGERPEQRYPEARRWLSRRGYRSTVDYLAAMCELVLKHTRLYPHSNAGTLTEREIDVLHPVNVSLGLMLESIEEHLLMPGGPHERAPSKHPRARLATLRRAGERGIPMTTGLLIGLGDGRAAQVRGLLAIRELQRAYGHIQEVIVQNFRAKPNTPMAAAEEPGQQEVMRIAAVARLALGGSMNLQVPPNLTANHYPRYLLAGINDWGGISPVTPDFVNPEAPWPSLAALRTATAAYGLTLRARFPVYPEIIRQRPQVLPATLRARLSAEADAEGYVPDGGGGANGDERMEPASTGGRGRSSNGDQPDGGQGVGTGTGGRRSHD